MRTDASRMCLEEQIASLALGSLCLPQAAKPICHPGACWSHVYINPNASPFPASESLYHGSRTSRDGDSRTAAIGWVTLGEPWRCRNPSPHTDDSLPFPVPAQNTDWNELKSSESRKTALLSTLPVWDLLKKALGCKEGRAAASRCFWRLY